MKLKILFTLIFLSTLSFAQLKEFTISTLPSPSEFPPIMRSHPDDGAIIIFSSISGLQFESNNNQINDIKEEEGKYTIFIKPEKTIIKIKKKEFIEQNLPLLSLLAKEVKYYKIESKQDINSSVIPINILTELTDTKIYIDGSFKGVEVTQQVSPGVHNIKIEKEGYSTIDTTIEVSTKINLFRYRMEKVELVPIQIKSVPDKAQIILNNTSKGETDRGMYIFPGTYQLKILKPGYLDIDTIVDVNDRKDNNFLFTLKKNSSKLNIAASPENCEILIDNILGKNGFNEILPGIHILNVAKEGYLPQSDTVSLHRGESLTKKYNLIKNAGELKISVIPEDASVLINKEDFSGRTNIELPGDKLNKTYQLRQKKGSILFNITPLDASVELSKDGKAIDRWKGMKKIKDLGVGKYDLSCSFTGYDNILKSIIINENQTTSEDINLEKNDGNTFLSSGSCAGTITYSGKIYHMVKIGSQCWLKENLDIGTMIAGTKKQSKDQLIEEKYCYNDDPANCVTYGGLYQWDVAMKLSKTAGAQGICPFGWHIPTEAEFNILNNTSQNDGNKLKAQGQGNSVNDGMNGNGFSALMSGFRDRTEGTFLYLVNAAYYWSSSEHSEFDANNLYLFSNTNKIGQHYTDKNYGLSIRCLKDN